MSNASGHILLLTGSPGIGKTTVVKKVVASLSDCTVSGFYTEEMRSGGARRGFELVGLSGGRWVMAHVDNRTSRCRVGKYGVDVGAIDAAVRVSLESNEAQLYLIDEIGRMECFSDFFIRRVSSLLESATPVIATVSLKGTGFIASVKRRSDAALWRLSEQNRNDTPASMVAWLKRKIPGRSMRHADAKLITKGGSV